MRVFYPAVFTTIYLVVALCSTAHAQDSPPCENWAARLESLEGKGTFKRNTEEGWQDASPGEFFCYGDTLKISELRAALRLENDTLVRLKAGSVIKFLPPKKAFWVEILDGAAHFISRTPKEFEIKAPYVNAAVEGTEFLVTHSESQDQVAVFEGTVLAKNSNGEIRLEAMQASSAGAGTAPTPAISISLREAANWTLHTPPLEITSDALPKNANDLINQGDFNAAIDALTQSQLTSPDALNTLSILYAFSGQLDEARKVNLQARDNDPESAEVQSIEAFLLLQAGERQAAVEKSARALTLSKNANANVLLIHSYVQQAQFQLPSALQSAERALALAPASAVAKIRVAELALSLGRQGLAKTTLRKTDAPTYLKPYATSLRALIALQDNRNRKAERLLQSAINENPNVPLSYFALGLTQIRLGQLQTGRANIELAVTLDPANSLYRSYAGKAYAAENREETAMAQFELAKSLDPNDPTPWFYTALEQQANNQLIASLQSFEKSRELNDGRAVYRSRMLLDQDAAARSTSQGRIYNTLGFEQQAILLGTEAVQQAPMEHSGHRLLAEVYGKEKQNEMLVAAERLQATIKQPLGAQPLPLGLSESGMMVVQGAGPGDLGINEYNSLFMQEGLNARAELLGGSRNTRAYDANAGLLWEQVALSIGQYRYKTDGFRENNDVDYKISNALLQWQPLQKLGFQVEVSQREDETGDLGLYFDPSSFSEDLRSDSETSNVRFSGNIDINSRNNIFFNTNKRSVKSTEATGEQSGNSEGDTSNYDLSYIMLKEQIKMFSGINYANSKLTTENPFFSLPIVNDETYKLAYFYTILPLLDGRFNITVGGDSVSNVIQISGDTGFGTAYSNSSKESSLYHKLGLSWNILDNLKLRLADFETSPRNPDAATTLSPTHISGFNQVFDFNARINTSNKSIALDHKVTKNSIYGITFTNQKINQGIFFPGINQSTVIERQLKHPHGDVYFDHILTNKTSLKISGKYNKIERDVKEGLSDPGTPLVLEDTIFSVGVTHQLNKWALGLLKLDKVKQFYQTEELSDFFIVPAIESTENFYLLGLKIEIRLPRNLGTIELKGENLTDEEFQYANFNFFTGSPRHQNITTGRSILVGISLNY